MAVATIDSGKMVGVLHGASATMFFVLWLLNMIFVTKGYAELRKIDKTTISYCSLLYKRIVTYTFLGLAVLVLIAFLNPDLVGDAVPYVPILEWAGMLALCLYLYSFTWDWKNYYYSFERYESEVPPILQYEL